MGKILALDVGDRRIGVAIGLLEQEMIFPRDAIDTKVSEPTQAIANLIASDNITMLIVGLPLNSDGSENEQCLKTREFVKKLNKIVDLPMSYVNEYASSKEANNIFASFGARKQIKPGVIDSSAASIILDSYFQKLKADAKDNY